MATGIVQILVGVIAERKTIAKIWEQGVFNTVNWDYQSHFLFWFLTAGFFWVILGHISHRKIQALNRPMPKVFGWYLLAFAVIASILQPISGAWLFYPQALIILLAKHNASIED
ncbi:MAG: hypothetical protein D6767_00025 [Candidatus Hydrogenedentota bacterium]|nr:MAG: hypothetical protein D6767_00025 [Candidatus Hydrogenedentota bacterium]